MCLSWPGEVRPGTKLRCAGGTAQIQAGSNVGGSWCLEEDVDEGDAEDDDDGDGGDDDDDDTTV
jgi:hypothetical protein